MKLATKAGERAAANVAAPRERPAREPAAAPVAQAAPMAWQLPEVTEPHLDAAVVRTRALLRRWAPLLGLQESAVEVSWEPGTQRHMAARRLAGLMRAGRVHMKPELYQADTELGRFVLAHELAHLAQRAEGALHPRARRGSLARAEREADRLAAALVLHDRAGRPQVLLPGDAEAAKEDAPHAPPKLGELVSQTRQRELEEIRGYLETGFFDWAVTDGDIDNIFRILEPLSFVLIRAISRALDFKERHKIASELSEGHFKRFRRPILAFYTGMDQWEFTFVPDNPFAGASLEGLSREEAFGVHYIAMNLRKQRPDWQPQPQHRKVLQKLQSEEYAAVLGDIAADLEAADKEEAIKEAAIGQERAAVRAGPAKDQLERFLEFARRKLRRGFDDWAVRDAEALAVLDAMSAFLRDAPLMRGAVEGLDRLELLDRFLDNLPIDALYLETSTSPESDSGIKVPVNRRRVLLKALGYRQPHKNVQLVETLLDKGFFSFDWVVTDEEAFFAFLLLKVVPPPAREAFFAAKEGEQAKRLFEEMSLSMREGPTMNFYSGGQGGADLTRIQQQLLEEKLWNGSSNGRLAGLLRMAIAAGEHEWLFGQSKWRYETSKPYQEECRKESFRRDIVDKFGLYRPGVREQFTAEVAKPLTGKPFGSDNGFALLIQLFDFLGAVDNIELISESVGADGIDFGELQDVLGGSISGARFRRHEDVDSETEAKLRDNAVRWDLDQGVIQMRAAKLMIDAIHYPLPNLKIQTASTLINELRLHLQYPAPQSPAGGSRTAVRLRIDFARIQELMLIGPDSMTSINEVVLRDVLVELMPEGTTLATPRDEIAWGNIFFTPLFNIIKVTGLDLQGIPILGALSVTGATERLAQGLKEPNTPLDVKVLAGEIKVSGVVTSGGQYIDDLTVKDFSVRSTSGRSGYKEWLKGEIERLETRAVGLALAPTPAKTVAFETGNTLSIQLESLKAELQGIERAEAERHELTERQKSGALSPEDQRKLTRVSQYLDHLDTAGQTGVAADVGEVTVKGVAGKVAMGDVSLKELHGHGRSGGAVLGFLFDSQAMNRFLRGPEYQQVIAGVEDEDPAFGLRFQELALQQVDLPGEIPTVAEADAQADKALGEAAKNPLANDIARDIRVLKALRRQEAARRYWQLAELAMHTPQKLTEADVQEFNRLREYFREQKTFHADSVKFTGGALELGASSVGTTQLSVFGESLEMTEVSAGGLTAKRIGGKNARIGANFNSGLAGLLKNPRGALGGAGLSADELTIEGVSHEQYGHLFDRFSLTKGVTAGFDERGNRIEAGTGLLSIEGFGISPRLALLRQRRIRLRLRNDRTKAQDEELARLDTDIAWMEDYLAQRREAYEKWVTAKTPEDKAAARSVIDESDSAVVLKLAEYGAAGITINEFGVRVTGLGDVLAPGFDIDAALKNGISIEGSGPQQRFMQSAKLSGLHAKTDDDKSSLVAGAEKVELGELRGKIDYSTEQIKFTNLTLQSLTLSKFMLTTLGAEADSGQQLYSDGTSVFSGIELTGELNFSPRKTIDPTGKQNLGEYRLSSIHIQSFRIAKLVADDLHYESFASKIHVTLRSGTLETIYVNDLHLPLPEDPKTDVIVTGQAGIEGIRDLEVQAALPGGFELQRGKLNGGGLHLDMLSDGTRHFAIGELNLAGGQLRGPDGWARFSFDNLRGDVYDRGNQVEIKKLAMDDFKLSRFQWKAGDAAVRSSEPTVLHGLWVNAELNYKEEVDTKGKKTKALDNVKISHLHVDKLTSEHLVYESGDLTIEITPRKSAAKGDPSPLEIETIDLTDLLWRPGKGVSRFTLDAAKANANFVTTIKSGLTKEIEVTTDLVATKLHAQLKRDGKMLASIDELSALAEGDVKGVKMKTLVSKAKTGTITYSPDDNKIEMPTFGISSLALQELSYDSSAFKVEVPSGHGGVVMVDIAVDMTVNLNPPPKKGAAPITPAPPRIKNVTINSFKVPTTTAWGLTFTLKDPTDPIVIKVDETKPAVLSGLGLKPATPLVFTPKLSATGTTTWDILGNVTLDSADVKQIGVEVGKSISAHADVTASTFTLDFLGSGKTRFNIASVTAQEIRGKLSNNDFKLITGKDGSKFQDPSDPSKPKPGIKLTNVGRDETGKFSMGDVGVYGFVYDDPSKGLHLDVAEALLKDQSGVAFTAKDGEIVVPSIEISNAYFRIEDVLKLGGGGGGGAASPISYTPDWTMLDHLDGTVSFAALLHSNSGSQRFFEGQIDVLVQITDGVVNFADIEDHAFGFGDWMVDFEVDTDKKPAQLYLELDMHKDQRMLEWDLDEQEQTLAESNQVRLRTFLKTRVVPQPPADPDDEPFRIESLHYKDASVDLHMPDDSKIVLGNAGTLQLGGGANSQHALRLWGSREGRLDHWGGLPLNLEAHIANTDLKIADGTKQLSVGQIHIDGLKDAHLDFNDKAVKEGINIDVPKKLEGTITHATAKNLRIKPVKP